jgi:hypothetical protein
MGRVKVAGKVGVKSAILQGRSGRQNCGCFAEDG